MLRALVGVVALGAALSTVALLLSDRAPGLLRSLFGDRVLDLWARIDAAQPVDLPQRSDLPPTDFVVHVAIWAVVAALVGLTVWTWRGLVVASSALVTASVALELAQGRWSSTRAVEASDAIANFLGIAAGTVVAAACYLAWSGAAGLVGRLRR